MSSYDPEYAAYYNALKREKRDISRRKRDHDPSRTNGHSRHRSRSPKGHKETILERYHRKKEKQNTETRNRRHASVIDKKQEVMPTMSVDVNVWWEDAGVKHERTFIIALAQEDVIGSPRPDELLSTKLKEKIPFEYWLSLSVKVDNQLRPGKMEKLYDRKIDTEEEVDEDLKLTQENMWLSDPEGKYNTKMVCVLKRVPPVVKGLNFVDSVPMPNSDVRLLLKALQIL
jgi:hypothetical protein